MPLELPSFEIILILKIILASLMRQTFYLSIVFRIVHSEYNEAKNSTNLYMFNIQLAKFANWY